MKSDFYNRLIGCDDHTMEMLADDAGVNDHKHYDRSVKHELLREYEHKMTIDGVSDVEQSIRFMILAWRSFGNEELATEAEQCLHDSPGVMKALTPMDESHRLTFMRGWCLH